MAARDMARASAVPGTILVVIHDFGARSADELSLLKGDRIELIERDDDFNDGWFLGRHIVSGVTGLFPEVYTAVAPRQPPGTQSSAALRRTSGSMPHAVQAQEASSTAASQRAPLQTQRPASGQTPFSKPMDMASSSVATRSSLPSTSTTTAKSLGLASAAQSPVMHETLTVIDEHMNDMNPAALRNTGRRDTMSSMYSSYPNNRMSYIAGHETEDEEGHLYTEAEVMRWSPAQVSEYLEDHGVEKSHCRVFREQEITGEVLLAMDQSSVFLKEFELGAVGRRLRTWHKIKALQEEVQRQAKPGAANTTSSPAISGVAHELDATDSARSVSGPAASAPRTGAASMRSSLTQNNASSQSIPLPSPGLIQSSSGASPRMSGRQQDAAYRPSAQNVRTLQHWRHSSIESTANSFDGSLTGAPRKGSTTGSQLNGRFGGANHSHTASTETTPYMNKDPVFAAATTSSPSDLDRGYFSSTEAETRVRRANVLQKKQNSMAASSTHSRNGSFMSSYARRSNPTGGRGAASTDSLHDPIASPTSSPILTPGSLLVGGPKSNASRTISMPTYGNKAMSSVNESAPPIVTKLEPSDSQIPTSTAPVIEGSTSSRLPFFSKTSKIPGMRAISDAVTRSERTTAVKDGEVSSPTKDGVSTPSTSAASFDLKSAPRTSSGSAGALTPQQPAAQRRSKPRTKKSTSAYTRGLEKKSPAEQMVDCDYSGWMKKKSGSLMTTWKPRLFVLRGRRLSYYYSENDTEEKGLIDISFHNVMPAMDERLISMHAVVTGAGGGSPASPMDTLTTTAQQELRDNPVQAGTEDHSGLFIFKLTPPKSGRGVNFTKPTVHYFAVNSRQEGRLWMAALMKAVIARDEDSVVTTTYSQQTISLAKARARKERPPALKDDDNDVNNNINGYNNITDTNTDGLGIGGLKRNGNSATALDGADRPYLTEDNSSVAPSSVPTAAPSIIADLGDLEADQLAKILH